MKIMTHVVAGFRSEAETETLISVMNDCHVDYIEVQIPFSDPIGDGPTISHANQYALDQGMTVQKSLRFFERMAAKSAVPLLIMTYANIVYRLGLSSFVKQAKEMGAAGLIVPDMPLLPFGRDAEQSGRGERFERDGAQGREDKGRVRQSAEQGGQGERDVILRDREDKEDDIMRFLEEAKACDIPIVPVISPNTTQSRMNAITSLLKNNPSLMVYCTRRTGVTGTHALGASNGDDYMQRVRSAFTMPIASGFGISSVDQIATLDKAIDIAVIGSHIINLFKDTPTSSSEGIDKVRGFLREVVARVL